MLVADLLRQDFFPDFQLICGGGGLGREISSVSVIDSPDVDRWMRGGEFLVGSGYIFQSDPGELAPFISRAAGKHVAALGIKLDRYHHNIPDCAVKSADALSLPLMLIPFRYRWTDINETIYRRLDRERRTRVGETGTGRGEDAACFWQDDADAGKILSQCAGLLGRTIVVSSPTLRYNHVFHPGGEVGGTESLGKRLSAAACEQRALPSRGQVAARMEYRDAAGEWQAVYNLTGAFPLTVRIILKEGESSPSEAQERMALRVVSLLRALAFENETYSPDAGPRRERFFEGLCLGIYNGEEMIAANLKELGVTLPPSSRVMIAAADEAGALNGWLPPEVPLSYRLGHFWTGLLPAPAGGRDNEDGRMPFEGDGGDRLYFALGSVARTPAEISRSYREANRMIAFIRSSALSPGVYLHEEFCLYSLFDGLNRLPEAEGVWKRYWEPLLRGADGRRGAQRLELARALIAADFNARLCSKKLHLHYNTIRNYIDELEDYLGIELPNRHHRLGLTLAFYIDRARRGR